MERKKIIFLKPQKILAAPISEKPAKIKKRNKPIS